MKLLLDRDKFWEGYRKEFLGIITPATVESLNIILDKFENETRIKNIPQYGYVLATAYHESGKAVTYNGKKVMQRFVPVKEVKGRSNSSIWIKYQSKYWLTGFYGRGLAQVTWEENYRKVGKLLGLGNKFVENPDLLLDTNWAYEALVIGMVKGIYRSDSKGRQTLDRYLPTANSGTLTNLTNAREIINGDKKKNGGLLADEALRFIKIINASRVAASNLNPLKGEPVVEQEVTEGVDSNITEDFTEGETTENGVQVISPEHNINDADTVNINTEPKVIVSSAADTTETTKETPSFFTKMWASVVAGVGAITTLGINLEVFLNRAVEGITLNHILFLVVALALVWLGYHWYNRSADRSNKLNQKLIDTASDTTKYTVSLVSK